MSSKSEGGRVSVSARSIQDMQRGYELRIARQRDAITRLQMLLEESQAKFAEWMRDEVSRAAYIDEHDQAPVLAVAGGGVIDDTELDELLVMVTSKWDTFNEDDTARTIVAGYIKHLEDDVDTSKMKQGHLVGRLNYLMSWVTSRSFDKGFTRELLDDPIMVTQGYIEYLEKALHQAQYDAKHNAQLVNQAQAVVMVDGDDTPPWEKQSSASFIQPATVGSSSVFSNEPAPEISETLTEWAGATQLPPGETRPGSF